jgi:hypothetical protein
MARYQDAIKWIAMNDDTEWLKDHPDKPSVTACLVADMWGHNVEKVAHDIRKFQKTKEYRRAFSAQVDNEENKLLKDS